jgi:alkylhydroperoxidase family enzyme
MGDTSTLAPREREILILRIGWLCQAEYEWGQHVIFARDAGLSDEEIARVKVGPNAEGWSEFDATLLRAVDELHNEAFVSDATWAALAEQYNEQQLMDVVFTVGQYNMVSMALNSFGVQLDKGVEGF